MTAQHPGSGETVVLAGGSGLIGRALAEDLHADGYRPVVLTRAPAGPDEIRWDGRTLGEWVGSLDGARALVNLTGRSVITRYTGPRRIEIVRSRVDSVRVLGAALRACDRPPPAWLQASSLAIYGDTGDQVLAEGAASGRGFSPEVCVAWEQALNDASRPGTRTVTLRMGLGFARGAGALGQLEQLTRLGLGGTVGRGRQWVSWLHLRDLVRIFRFCLEREVEGVFNATGPEPVRNATLMRELRRAVGRPWSPPVPVPAVRVGSWLMGVEPGLALEGRRGVPRRLTEAGFRFELPALRPALRALFDGPEAQGRLSRR
jgi:uncharacterized protein (TIGR01777 family)